MENEGSGERYCKQMNISLFTAYISLILFLFVFSLDSNLVVLLTILGIVNAVSLLSFSYSIGRLALLLEMNWIVWGFGSIIFSPIGTIIFYLKMKKHTKEKGW
jgi:hypothetical protein